MDFKLKKVSRRIYLDYASLTPIDHRVLDVVQKYSGVDYANPSAWYKEGVAAKKAMNSARKSIADSIRAHADEIIFTSGGTEANNLAILGVSKAFGKLFKEKRSTHSVSGVGGESVVGHIIISAIEHSSIMEVANRLEKQGIEVTRVGVDKDGVILLDEIKKAIKPETILVSIMTVNNETGVVQPIREIAKIIRQARQVHQLQIGNTKTSIGKIAGIYPLFHTDAAQAALYEDLNMEQLGVDMMTLDAGKIYGPRGIGALYIRRSLIVGMKSGDGGRLIEPILLGGGQERGLRSGTENLPSIMGFAKAFEIVTKKREKEVARISQLREYFLNELKGITPGLVVNGGSNNDSPHILNVSIPGIDNEFLLFQFDAAGIACSTKSSCLRDDNESYVLKAMGADSKTALRFSFGRWTKKADISNALKVIKGLLTKVSQSS